VYTVHQKLISEESKAMELEGNICTLEREKQSLKKHAAKLQDKVIFWFSFCSAFHHTLPSGRQCDFVFVQNLQLKLECVGDVFAGSVGDRLLAWTWR